jgi:hypothetical protein
MAETKKLRQGKKMGSVKPLTKVGDISIIKSTDTASPN